MIHYEITLKGKEAIQKVIRYSRASLIRPAVTEEETAIANSLCALALEKDDFTYQPMDPENVVLPITVAAFEHHGYINRTRVAQDQHEIIQGIEDFLNEA